MASFYRTYRVEGDKRIDGVYAMAFIHNFQYHLTHINIYQDGKIDCWGLVDFDGFKKKVRSGWVVTQPPEGATISVSFLASFKAVETQYWIKTEEFIKEVADEIEKLNGRPTTSDRCRDMWHVYQKNPTSENKRALKDAYESIPEHNRRYVLGDMDSKDWPVRTILYGIESDTDEAI